MRTYWVIFTHVDWLAESNPPERMQPCVEGSHLPLKLKT